jgi:hypothetical protein
MASSSTAAFIFPRSKGSLGQKKIGRGGTPVRLTKELLEDCMHLPICEASKLLGLSKTSVKKACRAVGIMTWSTKRQSSSLAKRQAARTALSAAVFYNSPPNEALDDGDASAADTNEDLTHGRSGVSSPQMSAAGRLSSPQMSAAGRLVMPSFGEGTMLPPVATDAHQNHDIAAINSILAHASEAMTSVPPLASLTSSQAALPNIGTNIPSFPLLVAALNAERRASAPAPPAPSASAAQAELLTLRNQLESERLVLEGKFASFRRLVEGHSPSPTNVAGAGASAPGGAATQPTVEALLGLLAQHRAAAAMSLPAPALHPSALSSGALLPPAPSLPIPSALPTSASISQFFYDAVHQGRRL